MRRSLTLLVKGNLLFQGHILFVGGDQYVLPDLVELGLCGTKDDDDASMNGIAWTLNESWAIACACAALEGMPSLPAADNATTNSLVAGAAHSALFRDCYQVLTRIVSDYGSKVTFRGFLAERIEWIPFTGPEYNTGAYVIDTPLFQLIRATPECKDLTFPTWLSTTKFRCTGWCSSDDCESDEGFLAYSRNWGTVLFPATAMRPGSCFSFFPLSAFDFIFEMLTHTEFSDGILLLVDDRPLVPERRHAVVTSSAIYSKRVDARKVRSLELSTDLKYAYHLANGRNVNPEYADRRQLFENDNLHALPGNLRIQYLLPGTTKEEPALCQVKGDDVIVNITSKHFLQLFAFLSRDFRAQMATLFASVTDTEPAMWIF